MKDDSLEKNFIQKTFQEEVNEIEGILISNQRSVNRKFFSSQYSEEQAERGRTLIHYRQGDFITIDFHRPDKDESQRYTLINQTFVKIDKKVHLIVPSIQ